MCHGSLKAALCGVAYPLGYERLWAWAVESEAIRRCYIGEGGWSGKKAVCKEANSAEACIFAHHVGSCTPHSLTDKISVEQGEEQFLVGADSASHIYPAGLARKL